MGLVEDWVCLDYTLEEINYKDMKWRYNQPPLDMDYRNLKRVSATEWFITSDHEDWEAYEDCGLLELYYQEFLTLGGCNEK